MSTTIDAIDAIESPVAAPLAETHVPTLAYADVRAALLARKEIALVDVREEDPYAQAHPLWAANLPLSAGTGSVVAHSAPGHVDRAVWRARWRGPRPARGGQAG